MDCPRCLFRSPAGARFCAQCGAPLAAGLSAVSVPEDRAERRHMTIMFCDLVDSVGLSTRLDAEEYREVLYRYLDAASTVVRRFAGFVGQYLGDGMLVYFGYPKAREDAAILGVRCGLGILRAIEGLNREFSPLLRVRIGLHTGLVVIGELGVLGKPTNVAARLQALALPDTVVMSGDTWKLVRAYFHCKDLGLHPLKGLPAPILVYQVLAEADPHAAWTTSCEPTPLYGRDPELSQLRERWAEAAAGGAPRLALTGEAGIGKSRLLREFVRSPGGQPHFLMVARGAAAAQTSAFEPLLQLLRERMEIGRAELPAQQLGKIADFAASWQFPPATTALLAAVLCPDEPAPSAAPALSPAAVRQGFIDWLPEFLRTLAARRPVIFVVEDLHWIDPSTLEALAHFFAVAPLARVLVLLTARPEFSAPWLPAEVLALHRLPAAEVVRFAEAVGGGRELPPELVREIVARANGVPLFVEELTKMVLESGRIVQPLAIPDTLHELLMARLDATGARELAQIAAVLGQEFSYAMLRSLEMSDEGTLQQQLARLVAAGLFSQDGVIPEATFAFRHALIQAEAYESLLRRKRRSYHERIADLLAAEFPEMLRQQPELVARHYTEAGRHVEAIEHWLHAATRSEARSANAEAAAQAAQGLALLAALPAGELRRERELALTIVRGRALALLQGYASGEVEQVYARARELCRESADRPETYQVLAVLHAYYTARADFSQAGEIAEQMLRLGESTGTSTFLDNAWLSLGAVAFYLGRWEKARRCFRRSVEIYECHRGPLPPRTLEVKAAAMAWHGLALLLCGQPDEGLAMVRAARDFATGTGHAHSIIFARHFLQLAHYWRDEAAGVLEECEGFAAICREQGFVYWLTLGTMIEGWAEVRLGEVSGMELLEKGLAGWLRTGARLGGAQHHGFVADASARTGDTAAGLAAIAEAEALARVTGERCYAPHVAELHGLLLLRQTPPDVAGAEAALRTALALARELGTAWLALRAATPLAALLRDQGRHDEAHAVLEAALGAITGGSETSLVRAARELLAGRPRAQN